MDRNPGSASLKVEVLETRDVPAIIVNAMFNAQRTDAAPIGGQVGISEIQLTLSDTLFTRNNRAAPRVNKPASSNDFITFSLSGNTLTITDQDGIFGRVVNGNNIIVTYGTTLQIGGVTGFNLGLQAGGNDIVTDNTPLATTLDGGPGNDTITGKGIDGTLPSFLLFQTTGTADPTALSTFVPAKGLIGGDGNDTLNVTGAASGWLLDGGAGDDTLNGPQFGFFNLFRGGDDNDRIVGPVLGSFNMFDGGFGNDTVIGGFGFDSLMGGAGLDIFIGFGGGDAFLARDVEIDFIVNLPGDTVLDDPFDVRTFRTLPPLP